MTRGAQPRSRRCLPLQDSQQLSPCEALWSLLTPAHFTRWVWLQTEGWRVSTPHCTQWPGPCLEGRGYWCDSPPPSLMKGTEGHVFPSRKFPPGRWSHAYNSNGISQRRDGTLCRSLEEKLWQSPSQESFGLPNLIILFSIPPKVPA